MEVAIHIPVVIVNLLAWGEFPIETMFIVELVCSFISERGARSSRADGVKYLAGVRLVMRERGDTSTDRLLIDDRRFRLDHLFNVLLCSRRDSISTASETTHIPPRKVVPMFTSDVMRGGASDVS